MEIETRIAIFKKQEIRKALYKNEWWFSILDVVSVLTNSPQPKTYWAKMKDRDKEMSQPFPFWEQLKLTAEDGKMRETDCADTEGILRIIQSIPSPKAEPFKRWLAKVGYERMQGIENPELATKRTRLLYKLKGYSDDWIEKRMRGIAIREELTKCEPLSVSHFDLAGQLSQKRIFCPAHQPFSKIQKEKSFNRPHCFSWSSFIYLD